MSHPTPDVISRRLPKTHPPAPPTPGTTGLFSSLLATSRAWYRQHSQMSHPTPDVISRRLPKTHPPAPPTLGTT
ncbi:MAG: hypothetical protein K0U66_10455, partial [Gammaproteobacteria bacterium]|nr:hypothetical protein [Gammaproteobacteria bacterium]